MGIEADGDAPPLKNEQVAIQQLEARVHALEHGPVAIVGAGLRFPGGARDLDRYWRLLVDGVDAVRPVPADRWDKARWPEAPAEGGFLDDVATFDPEFFRISPREALELDPAQRLLLEVAWEALENAAIAPDHLERTQTGVYVGLGLSDYGRRHFLGPDPSRITAYSGTGSFLSVAAGRISYTLGLHGPAMTIDTACSSSLVSVHLAVDALRRGEIDAALAGGANLVLAPEPSVYFARLEALAPDGRCKTFSANADGYGRGEGAGMVVLKRLDDAVAHGDRILAVILGSAVNQDGRSNGLTAPSGRAQQAVLRSALRNAEIEADAVGMIEAHGTGTPLGDPIEIDALKAVFGSARQDGRPLWMGSVKANFGHLETAAGIAGLLKLALSVHHGRIPPHLHSHPLNPRIRLDGTPLAIPVEGAAWDDGVRIGGVSSFGLSGTNAHILLGPAPRALPESAERLPVELITLSARGDDALAATAKAWSASVIDAPLADVSYTAQVGRSGLRDRLAVVARSPEEAADRLKAFARGDEPSGTTVGSAQGGDRTVVFLFTGQGAQYPGMGKALYDGDATFRGALDEAMAAVDAHLAQPLADAMWGPGDAIHDTRFTQPALFALEVALARWWLHHGVEPDAVIGHSIGEIAAAHVAGVISLSDAAALVVARGRLMSELPREGAMLAIFAGVDQVDEALKGRDSVSVAAVNGPTETVISGRADVVEEIAAGFEAREVQVRRLTVSHAFHSALMDPMLPAFRKVATSITLAPPSIPLVSNLDGALAGPRVADPEYWVRHVRGAVRFADGFRTLLAEGHRVFLELGPRPVLLGMGRRSSGDAAPVFVPSLHPDRPDVEGMTLAIGALWANGVHVDLARLHAHGRRLAMPPTVRIGERYWLDPIDAFAAPSAGVAGPVTEIAWRAIESRPGGASGDWVVLGDDDVARALAARGATVHREWVDVPAGVVVAPTGNDPVEHAWQAAEAAQRLVRSPGDARLFTVGRADAPATATLYGVGRVVALEHPERWGAAIQVDGGSVDAVVDAILGDHGESDLRITAEQTLAARLVPAGPPEPSVIDWTAGAVWVTGGFGALGRRVARWLVDQGATALLLTGRRGATTEAAKALVAELRDRGVSVTAAMADVAEADDVTRVLGELDQPLLGIVHAAGTNDDGGLMELSWPRFEAVQRAKVQGAVNLHEATAGQPLSFFVLFSSAAGILGTPGQANYAAANAFLDAFARWRQRQGLPGVSLAWGPWDGDGMAAAVSDDVRERWAREGVRAIQPADGLRILGERLTDSRPVLLVAPFDWPAFQRSRPADRRLSELRDTGVPSRDTPPAPAQPEGGILGELAAAPEGARLRMMRDHVQRVVSRVLGRGADQPIPTAEGFFDAGMDSLMAMELRDRLQASVSRALSATVAFDFPDVDRLAVHLLSIAALDDAPAPTAAGEPVRRPDHGGPVAVVGAACRLPGGVDDLDALWALLEAGTDAIVEVPPERFDIDRYYDPEPGTPGRTNSRHGGFIDGIDQFDPRHFGIAPREAPTLDPQQRLLLEVTWHALENAGIAPLSLAETRAGVYVGIGTSEYGHRFDPTSEDADLYAGTGNEPSFAAGRVAHALRLQGPAMSVNTACSSSLVSVHLAMQALRRGECEVAVAGGVNAIVGPENTLWMSMLGALAPDGRCKAFDHRADGYVRSEGCGMVVLKPLAAAERDGDRILAVLRGSAVNHDGPSTGLTVPNGRAQQHVIRAALADAGLAPDDVGLVECHGTGTALGDPIEVQALGEVFGAARKEPLYLGSIKTNLGHLEAGAGIAGLLKAVVCLQHGAVPPLVHFEAPNPALPLEAFPALTLPAARTAWPKADAPRRAGVSSFGISGTNAHLVVEEAPAPAIADQAGGRPAALITLSSRTKTGLSDQARALAHHLTTHRPDLADVAYTQNTGRAALRQRAAVVAASPEEAVAQLEAALLPIVDTALDKPPVVFLCTGAGPQEPGMARALYDGSATFRAALDEAAAAVDALLEIPLLDVMFPPDGTERPELHDLAYTQPAMFAVEWAMAALWRSYGVVPDAVIGHSTGQFVAACLAGVFDLPTGMRLIAKRASLMASLPRDGEMVSVFAPEDAVRAYLHTHDPAGAHTAVAAVNGPEEAVISGRADLIGAVADQIEADGIEIRRLRISHAAHSPLMEPILDAFEALMADVPLEAPRIPLIENVHGAPATDAILDPATWRRHMREPVQMLAGLRTLEAGGYRTFLEIGNHPVLAGMAARCITDPEARFVASLRRSQEDWPTLLEAVGRLWARGVAVDARGVHAEQPGQPISLPGTRFQRRRYWVDRVDPADRGHAAEIGLDWTYTETWSPVRPDVGAAGTRGSAPIVLLGHGQGLADRLADRQQRRCVRVLAGDAYHVEGDRYTVDPAEPEHLARVLADVKPALVVGLWSLDLREGDGTDAAADARPAVVAALHTLQAALQHGHPAVWWITRGAVSVAGEAPDLAQVPVLGLANVAAVEIDLPLVRLDLDPNAAIDDPAPLELALNGGFREDQLAVRDGQLLARRLVRAIAAPGGAPGLRGDAAYLITGGLGALGLRVARWLADHGAGTLVLTSRSAPDAAQQSVIAELDGRPGVHCVHVRADVGIAADVDRLVAEATRLAPIAGVFHAAGVVRDAPLATLTATDLDPSWHAKISGAQYLDRAVPEAELFVLFSSAASMLGSAGQGAYAAANAWLDALADHRRARGQHALAIGWGPWAGAGLAAASDRAWEAGGVRPLPPVRAVQVMGQLLGSSLTKVAVVDLDWALWPRSLARVPALVTDLARLDAPSAAPALRAALEVADPSRRATILGDAIASFVSQILRIEPHEVQRDVGFSDAGMDSLMAVELANRLRAELDPTLPVTIAFDHPSVERLTAYLLPDDAVAAMPVGAGTRRIDLDEPIAVIGLSCRMPGGANSPEAFWELLRSGRDPMVEIPPERWDLSAFYDPVPGTPGKMYTREAGFVDFDLVEGFDASFFGISGREAASLDPQQRMLLEVSYEALERAGLPTDQLSGSLTGVYVGVGDSGYLQRFQGAGELLYDDLYAGTGSLAAFASGRVAHLLGLQGPNLALNTACSSSLVAIHLACQGLRAGECTVALAGGVHLMLSPENFVYVSQLEALAADGRCKTFDAGADGYGRAEGCGMVVLERLSDATRRGHPILAVIRGTAMGHDGRSSGLTVPRGPAQEKVLADALARSGLSPGDVSYLEAHGTGTELGDPIEVHAIEAVYGPGRAADNPLHLGAVKSNVGHLEIAAGAASIVKTILALGHREIPPHLHFESPNPDIELTSLTIDTQPTRWEPPSGVLRAGVSAFGLAGTNVHLVLEEPPAMPDALDTPDETRRDHPGATVLPISARSGSALRALAARYGELLADHALIDVAASAATTRAALPMRLTVTAPDAGQAAEHLAAWLAHGDTPGIVEGTARRSARIAFLFSGQGSQIRGMGRSLYHAFGAYRDELDRCASVVDEILDRPLRDVLHGTDDAIHDTTYTQPGLYAHEVALAALWRSWGVEPAAVCGHSIGQLAAAAVAGVFSIEDGARLVAHRGRLMGSLARGGTMVAVLADEPTVRAHLEGREGVGVAAVNHPGEVVLSGDLHQVERITATLEAAGIEVRSLTVSHAFHSTLMDPILDAFEAEAAAITYHPPRIPVLCNARGTVADDAELQQPAYWRDLVRQPVRFADNLEQLARDGHDVFVEIGPHTSLLAMGRRTLPDRALTWIGSQRRDTPEIPQLLEAVAQLWVRGGPVDWTTVHGPDRRRVALPTYPWQRSRHWLDKPEWPMKGTQVDRDWFVAVDWEPVAEAPRLPATGRWLLLGAGDRVQELQGALHARGADATIADHAEAELLDGVDQVVVVADRHPPDPGPDPSVDAARLAALVRALVEHDIGAHLSLVTSEAVAAGAPVADPRAGALWGLMRVVSLEHHELEATAVDAALDVDADRIVDALLAPGEPEQALRGEERRVRRLDRAQAAAAPRLLPRATYLVTGGLRGLGLHVAQYLVDRGADHLVLLGRTAPDDDAQATIAALRDRGIEVTVAQGDVADADDVARIIAGIGAAVPLRGIVHAAGVTRDASLLNLDDEAFREVFAPKVQGAWHLWCATADLELDFFVLFAAGAGLLGAPGQGNYAAANAWLDSFAHWGRGQGRRVTSIDFGAWAEVGMAARLGPDHAMRQQREGIGQLPLTAGLAALGRLLAVDHAQIGVLDVDWPRVVATVYQGRRAPHLERLVPVDLRAAAPGGVDAGGDPPLAAALRGVSGEEHRRAVVSGRIQRLALRVLKLPPDQVVDPDTPLLDLGLDSLLAVELKNALMDDGVDIPVARVLTGPSLDQLSVLALRVHDAAAPEIRPTPQGPVAPPIHPVASHFAFLVLGVILAIGLYALTQAVTEPTVDRGPAPTRAEVEQLADPPARMRPPPRVKAKRSPRR